MVTVQVSVTVVHVVVTLSCSQCDGGCGGHCVIGERDAGSCGGHCVQVIVTVVYVVVTVCRLT